MCVLAAVAAVAVGVGRDRGRPSWPVLTGKLALFAAAFAVPTMLWVGLVRRIAGASFAPETDQYRQFVWMLDSWRVGGLPQLERRTGIFVAEFAARLSALARITWPY